MICAELTEYERVTRNHRHSCSMRCRGQRELTLGANISQPNQRTSELCILMVPQEMLLDATCCCLYVTHGQFDLSLNREGQCHTDAPAGASCIQSIHVIPDAHLLNSFIYFLVTYVRHGEINHHLEPVKPPDMVESSAAVIKRLCRWQAVSPVIWSRNLSRAVRRRNSPSDSRAVH